MITRIFVLLTWLCVCTVAKAAEPPPERESIAFVGVNVVPMTSEIVLERQTVVVSGRVITAMGKEGTVRVPRRAVVVQSRGKYLMPGLAEMHAHVPSSAKSRAYRDDVLFLYVANGITFARGMLGDPEHLTLRTALASHQILGPRLYTSGPSLNGQSVKSAEQGAAMVREQKQAGYDFIKLHPGLSRDAFLAIARTAHEVGIPFGGHVSQDVGLSLTFENHQATVDHLDGYVLAVSSAAGDRTNSPDNLGLAMKFEPQRVPQVAASTKAAGTWVVPTQSLSENMVGRDTPDVLDARPEMRYVPPAQRAQYRKSKQSTLDIKSLTPELSAKYLDVRRQVIRALSDAGAGLLLGSDSPQLFNVPGFAAHRELQSMVHAGLTSYQALRMGTVAPAEFVGEPGQFGIVAVGASADLVLLEANPLADVPNTQKISGVMVRGRWLDRSFIDAGLAEIEKRAPTATVAELRPGQEFRECADCPQMIVLPGGSFVMGAPPDEPRAPWLTPEKRRSNDPEGPQHEVSVRAFALGKFAVTRAQWAAFAVATNRTTKGGCEWSGFPREEATLAAASWRNLGFAQDDDHPVVCVSWIDAQDYVRWLTERTGHIYRLPSEAEWEYAARAGSTSAYPWGETASHDHANYGTDACCAELAEGRDRWLHTSPVGSFPSNAFGLFDMHGNAWQWIQDCYADSYAVAPTDGAAHDESNCQRRVLRGGTWGDPPGLIRSAARNYAPPPPSRWNPQWEYRSGGVGFRVVRVL